jgi:protein-S-isoprenylcysteine O-methyltransferase Ste14
MRRAVFFGYGLMCHLMFLGVFAYMMAFAGNFVVPITIDASDAAFGWGGWGSLLWNSLLITGFGLQHSVMARPGFKAWLTRFVPSEIERSTYVLVSNVVLIVLILLWQPIGETVWDVRNPVARNALWALFGIGWLMVPAVSLLINHFDLFGTRQVWLNLRGQVYTQLPFRTPGLYSLVRHPLYIGWMIAFWATPTMSAGHLLFAGLMTAYMLVAIPIEERDLIQVFGDRYRSYRRSVPALIPGLGNRSREEASA